LQTAEASENDGTMFVEGDSDAGQHGNEDAKSSSRSLQHAAARPQADSGMQSVCLEISPDRLQGGRDEVGEGGNGKGGRGTFMSQHLLKGWAQHTKRERERARPQNEQEQKTRVETSTGEARMRPIGQQWMPASGYNLKVREEFM
jgi:hypothetical protein